MIRHTLAHAAPIAALSLLAACSTTEESPPPPVLMPTPTPAPAPAPALAPPQVTTPSFDNWMDAPPTPGDWFYRRSAYGRSFAGYGPPFGEPMFVISCDRTRQVVMLERESDVAGSAPMQIRTESGDRLLTALPTGADIPSIAASLPANDPLLDMIAISKGRFAVEIPGMNNLYMPSWPEITRVIEDCR